MIKHAAATPGLLQHRGRAVVFTSLEDLRRRVHDPDLDVTPDDVLVLQNAGPIGGPGMPEAGMIPIPKKLLEQGVRDMVRISDARMSGTAFGTVVLHVAPESAIGGPLLAVRDGDEIELDVPNRRITLHVSDAEIARRLAETGLPERDPLLRRGYGWMHAEHVTQANMVATSTSRGAIREIERNPGRRAVDGAAAVEDGVHATERLSVWL